VLSCSRRSEAQETDLFEGKMWIDNQNFSIVRITGHLAKSPSFWIKQVDFVRDYRRSMDSGFSREKKQFQPQDIPQGDFDDRLPKLFCQWTGSSSASSHEVD